MAITVSDAERVRSLLKNFRDVPVDTTGASDSVLGTIFGYLMKVPTDGDGTLHWFCSRADQLTVDAATFLIRLHAYSSNRVNTWKERLEMCLTGCAACVDARQLAKTTSRQTYFGAFSDDILQGFYRSIDEWEISVVVSSLTKSGFNADSPDSGNSSLADLSPGTVYLMFCNLAVFEDRRVQSVILAKIPTVPLLGWPLASPPVGLILLTMADRDEARMWARQQLQGFKVEPIPKDRFTESYGKIVYPMVSAVASTGYSANGPVPRSFSKSSLNNNAANITPISFSFVKDPDALWSGFATAMRLLPAAAMSPSKYCSLDLRDIIIGHLHDTGPRFIEILRCLRYLIERCQSSLWHGGRSEYAQIVFNAVKDNRSFVEVFQSQDVIARENWALNWIDNFMTSIWDVSSFGDVLATVTDFLCEELQHERFQDARPSVMSIAIKILDKLLLKSVQEKTEHRRTVSGIIDIHAHTMISVAFARGYNDPKWRNARVAARGLIKARLLDDVRHIADTITALCKYNRDATTGLPDPPVVQQSIWMDIYKSLQPHDTEGLAVILSVVSSTVHMDELSKKAFAKSIQANPKVDSILVAVNSTLASFRGGLLESITRYANYNTSSSILDLLRQQDVVKYIMALMLCPIEEATLGAQNLVGQAFDVDVRLDCFRALLENLPNVSLKSINHFLQIFISYIPEVPEACSLSKSLVRCLTDVIEVLCSSPDGLLRKDHFLKGETGKGVSDDVLELWHSMTRTIALIFRLTPAWAQHFENEEMTVWMRDALIFGRDMLAQRRVFESGMLPQSQKFQQSSRKLPRSSNIGKVLMDNLQSVLPELARWLRLTDEELLHQSFSLLQSLLESFRETGVAPSEAGLKRLNKFIDDARKKDTQRLQTRLDNARISQLEETLASLDDDVQIISYRPPSDTVKNTQSASAEPRPKDTVRDRGKTSKRPAQGDRKSSPKTSATMKPAGPTIPSRDLARSGSIAATEGDKSARENVPLAPSRSMQGPKSESSTAKGVLSESSSSDEESDEDEEMKEGGLAALGKLQRTPKIKKTAERRQVKILDTTVGGKTGPNRLLDARREAQRTAMRLKPDISSLHKALLSWNYDHNSPEPPMLDHKLALTRVPDQFKDYAHYRSIFEPLLLFECWSQLVQSREEPNQDAFTCKIASRGFVDDWLDLDISITDSVKKDWALTETDVVLLRQPQGGKSILGKTQNYRALHYGIQATIRCYMPNAATDPGLHINSDWRLTKVFSLSTLHREYAALMALPFYDFVDMILQTRLSSKPLLDAREIRQAQDVYKVNEPQAIAILSSLKSNGFTLIQGPPGTGKTSTICGLVHAFKSQRPRPVTAINIGRSAGPADKEPTKKILLCAPSNAAVDEIAHRLKDGVCGAGQGQRLKVVRVGNEKSVNISVKDITLNYLVEQKLNGNGSLGTQGDTSSEITALRGEIETVKRLKQQKQDELHGIRDNAARTLALEEEIRVLNSKRMNLTQQFDRMKDQQKSDYRTLDATRRKYRTEVILEADVICGTLSSVGHEILEQCDFDMVIIDEAAQAIELSSLIPLKYRTGRCVMVGDPQQLPPTVISQEASKYLYNQSLFVRLQKQKPESVHLLSIQYRMHPDISVFPSRAFYQGQLQDGPDMAEKTRQPWHSHGKFGTYRFFSVSHGRETEGGQHSLINKAECQIAVSLYGRLRKEFSMFDFDFRVGVVSMYRAQIAEMRRAFIQRFGQDIVGKVDFNTVDGFQGQEKDVIILSCVRAGPGVQSIGFLSDTRRMNVALTRAKSSLFVLGHASTLERSNTSWKDIVLDARLRSRLAEVDTSFFTTPGDSLSTVVTTGPPKPVSFSVSAATVRPPSPKLLTPRQFTDQRIQAQSGTSQPMSGVSPSISPCKSPDVDMTDSSAKTIPLKRSTDGTVPTRLPPALRTEEDKWGQPSGSQKWPMENPVLKRLPAAQQEQEQSNGAKPRPRPPVKRPKQGPNLFIPKKR